MTNMTCLHCQEPLERAASYRGYEWIHTSGYAYCTRGGAFLNTKAEPAHPGTVTIPLRYADTGETILDDDEEEPECEGHESLAGAHMGETVFCDGTCR